MPSVYFIEPILGAWESCLATANPLCRRYPKSKKTEGLVLENDVLDERKRFDQLFAIDYLQTMKAGYLDVGKLHMYYEIHGRGDPLLMLHGEFAATGMFSLVTPQLRRTRRVILVDQQGHGRTGDIDRPLSFKQMAEDTAALLKQLSIEKVDVFGYSGGGTVALQLAVERPHLVRRLALASAIYDEHGYYPGVMEQLKNPVPDAFPLPLRKAYEGVAPKPGDWKNLVYKSAEMARNPATAGFLERSQLQEIVGPTLVIIGDKDFIDPDYAANMAEALHTELVILPGDHSSYVAEQPIMLLAALNDFFG